MSGPKPPKPSQQELELQSQQGQLLQQQREALEQQLQQQQFLQPLLLQQQGLRPVYGDVTREVSKPAPPGQFWTKDTNDQWALVPDTDYYRKKHPIRQQEIVETVTQPGLTGYEDILAPQREEALQRQANLESLQQELAKQQLTLQTELTPLQKQLLEQQLAFQGQQTQRAQEAQALEQRLLPELFRAQGYEPVIDPSGKLTGLTLGTSLQRQREIEDLLRQRSLAALKGELPVDPALLQGLEREERNLREQLRRNIGAGYEVSSPGIETLGEFAKRRSSILEGARRGDISLAEGLGLARGAESREQAAATLGALRGVYPYAGGAAGGDFGIGSATGLPQSPSTSLAQLAQLLGGGGGGGNLVGGLAGFQEQLANQRLQGYRQSLAAQQARTGTSSSLGGLAGGVLGGAAGAYFGGPAGGTLGYTLGSAGGSLAGTGLSYL